MKVFEVPLVSKVHARFGAAFGKSPDDKKAGSLLQNKQKILGNPDGVERVVATSCSPKTTALAMKRS